MLHKWFVGPSILKGGQETPSDEPKPFTGKKTIETFELFSKRSATPGKKSFVFHDTAGPGNWKRMVANSQLGVTFSIDQFGQIRQHNPLKGTQTRHAGGMNSISHGVEVVNPFVERFVDKNGKVHNRKPWPSQEVIAAPWIGGNKEVIAPSPAQMESGWNLVQHLRDLPYEEGGGLVFAWPGLHENPDGTREWIFRTLPFNPKSRDGIYAHGHTSDNRSDGYLVSLYTMLRHEGFSPAAAYRAVVKSSAEAKPRRGLWYGPVPPAPKMGGVAAAVVTTVGLATAGVLVIKYLPKIWK